MAFIGSEFIRIGDYGEREFVVPQPAEAGYTIYRVAGGWRPWTQTGGVEDPYTIQSQFGLLLQVPRSADAPDLVVRLGGRATVTDISTPSETPLTYDEVGDHEDYYEGRCVYGGLGGMDDGGGRGGDCPPVQTLNTGGPNPQTFDVSASGGGGATVIYRGGVPYIICGGIGGRADTYYAYYPGTDPAADTVWTKAEWPGGNFVADSGTVGAGPPPEYPPRPPETFYTEDWMDTTTASEIYSGAAGGPFNGADGILDFTDFNAETTGLPSGGGGGGYGGGGSGYVGHAYGSAGGEGASVFVAGTGQNGGSIAPTNTQVYQVEQVGINTQDIDTPELRWKQGFGRLLVSFYTYDGPDPGEGENIGGWYVGRIPMGTRPPDTGGGT